MFSKDQFAQNLVQKAVNRRDVLKLGLVAAASLIVPVNAFSSVNDFSTDERMLCLYNLHTKEALKTVYWKKGRYIDEALVKINHIMRDHYSGAVRSMDKKLLDFLFSIQKKLGADGPFHIISAYRTKRTNELLRKRNKKAAKYSLHTKGKAIDIRLPHHKIKELRHAAYKIKAGGVGYYPKANFVHVDAGAVRFWRSS
jgi:uncharacterized protein YcbK (DUF882 family)